MIRMYRCGATLQEIGNRFSLTRERVRQILAKAGLTRHEGGVAVRKTARYAAHVARLDARCIAKFGCTFAQRRELLGIGKQMMATGISYERTPLGAFQMHRANAGRRGIEWNLTLWQWWTLWRDSGYWDKRGRGYGYCMARRGDKGPYAIGNVYFTTCAGNASDQYLWRPQAVAA